MRRQLTVVMLLVALAVIALGCGSGSSSTPSGMNGPTSLLAASWSIAINGGGQVSTLQAAFVPNGTAPNWPNGISTCLSFLGCVDLAACNLQWIYGADPDISVQGPACFTAATEAGLGSISDSNGATDLILLVGAPQNPVPSGSTLRFAFLETYQGAVWLFTGTGTVNAGNITGSWTCSDAYADVLGTSCSGQGGTFSATQD